MVDNRTITIEYLPNELLLLIFSFHRLLFGEGNRPPHQENIHLLIYLSTFRKNRGFFCASLLLKMHLGINFFSILGSLSTFRLFHSYESKKVSGRFPDASAAWRWHTLAHVCRRWRDLIFSSIRHLKARLILPRKSPKTPPNSWPALPLSVWYSGNANYMPWEQEADIAFKNSDRIHEISLPMMIGLLFWRLVCNKSLPELECLTLYGPPRITLPPLPQLLLSSRGLASLHLGLSTLTRYGLISPEVHSTALSSTTQLEYLCITCDRVRSESHLELTSPNSSPHGLVVLPALTYFSCGRFIEYLENFVSWIHAPHLMRLNPRIFSMTDWYIGSAGRSISVTIYKRTISPKGQ